MRVGKVALNKVGQAKQVIKIENIKLAKKKGEKEKYSFTFHFLRKEQHGKGPVLEIYAQIGSCICPVVILPPLPGGEGVYCSTPVRLSFRLSKIFSSVIIDGRNLVFGHKLHIGMPYCG